MAMVRITILEKRLSDGSHVYDVALPEAKLNAVTENDAYDLAMGIAALIEKHTNDRATFGTVTARGQ